MYGTKLKQLIKSNGYNLTQFASAIDKPLSNVSFWCNQEYPPLEALVLCLKKLDIPLWKFFMDSGSVSIHPIQLEFLQNLNRLPDATHEKILKMMIDIVDLFLESN